jgi:hypothetical protein
MLKLLTTIEEDPLSRLRWLVSLSEFSENNRIPPRRSRKLMRRLSAVLLKTLMVTTYQGRIGSKICERVSAP